MKAAKYLFVYITPLVILLSLLSGNAWSFGALIFVFGLVPLSELFLKPDATNLDNDALENLKKQHSFRLILYGLVPFHLLNMMVFLNQMASANPDKVYLVGAIIAFGLSCGVLGINAAHELGHQKHQYDHFLSKILLLTTQYTHFFIEHNQGHHAHVATKNDPASSRRGEHIYQFYYRSILGGYLSAWRINNKHLHLQQKSFWSIHNAMLMYQVFQFVLLMGIGLIFGQNVLFYYLIACLIGILLLETVNYIEHYGLYRTFDGNKFERTKPTHSWNSNHPLGRVLLLELSRHSDHHYAAARPYQTLRHHHASPQMPTGYPGMMLLALIPPLWFRVMHKKLDNLEQ